MQDIWSLNLYHKVRSKKTISLPFSDEKSDGGDERDDSNERREVASARVLVHHANLFAFRLKKLMRFGKKTIEISFYEID